MERGSLSTQGTVGRDSFCLYNIIQVMVGRVYIIYTGHGGEGFTLSI